MRKPIPIFLLVLLTGFVACQIIGKLKNKIDYYDQPVCKSKTILTSPSAFFLIYGDGLGNSDFKKVKKAMLKKCKTCDGIYTGDIYSKDYDPVKEIRKTFMVLGNHDYERDPRDLISKKHLTFPCAYYGLETPVFSFFMFDTNRLDKKQLLEAEDFLCNTRRVPVGVGHHPILSFESNHGDPKELAKMRPVLEVLKKCKVNTYFSGHSHGLEHNSIEGVDNFISGAAGREPRPMNRLPGGHLNYSGLGYILLDYEMGALFGMFRIRFFGLDNVAMHTVRMTRWL